MHISELNQNFSDYQDTDFFLFDYVGHSDLTFLGPHNLNVPVKRVVRSIENLPGKKIIVLDSCTDVFIKRHNPKKGTLLIGCFDASYQSPISSSLYDAVIARGKSLESLTPETFKEMNHHWVSCKEAKDA
jgi:hypothetical protein